MVLQVRNLKAEIEAVINSNENLKIDETSKDKFVNVITMVINSGIDIIKQITAAAGADTSAGTDFKTYNENFTTFSNVFKTLGENVKTFGSELNSQLSAFPIDKAQPFVDFITGLNAENRFANIIDSVIKLENINMNTLSPLSNLMENLDKASSNVEGLIKTDSVMNTFKLIGESKFNKSASLKSNNVTNFGVMTEFLEIGSKISKQSRNFSSIAESVTVMKDSINGLDFENLSMTRDLFDSFAKLSSKDAKDNLKEVMKELADKMDEIIEAIQGNSDESTSRIDNMSTTADGGGTQDVVPAKSENKENVRSALNQIQTTLSAISNKLSSNSSDSNTITSMEVSIAQDSIEALADVMKQ